MSRHAYVRTLLDVPVVVVIRRPRAGLSVLTTGANGFDHSIIIEVKDPHSLASSCPAGVSPCLADGSLSVVLDGQEALLAPGTVSLSPDVEVSAANLPGACRSFGFEEVGRSSRSKKPVLELFYRRLVVAWCLWRPVLPVLAPRACLGVRFVHTR